MIIFVALDINISVLQLFCLNLGVIRVLNAVGKYTQMRIKTQIQCFICTACAILFTALPAMSQNKRSREVENLVSENSLRRDVAFLSSGICTGRAAGSAGAVETNFWIADQFEKAGLKKVCSSWFEHFRAPGNVRCHNVIGMLEGSKYYHRDSYIIIGAHYDHLGELNGTLYPGADANGSGVASMIAIMRMFSYMRSKGITFTSNILFVAFDAKELSLAGSEALWKDIKGEYLTDPTTGKRIKASQIRLVVNIDQVGSSLAPLSSGREDYLIMLGNNSIAKSHQSYAKEVNNTFGTGLELAYNYYGSDKFTEVFYKKVADQKVFVANGKPAILFTSGITYKTNKPSDTADTLNYPVLRRRVIFMFHWLEKFLQI